jgi:beta-lactamase class A
VTAAVEDLHTGQRYVYNPGLALVTASTVKVQILGTLLAEAQAAQRALTPQEQSLAAAMIEVSDNNAATALFQAVGGAPSLAAFDRSIGMTASTPLPSWSVATTTATDQLILLSAFVNPNTVLTDASRSYGLALLGQVAPNDVFGVSAGVAPGALRAVKTGRLPSIGVINGIGWVEGQGRNYLIAALTQGQPSDQ